MDKAKKTLTQQQTPEPERHNEVWLVAKWNKWNKWHDVTDYCILETQSPKAQRKKKKTMDEYKSFPQWVIFSSTTGKMTVAKDFFHTTRRRFDANHNDLINYHQTELWEPLSSPSEILEYNWTPEQLLVTN